MKRDHVRQRERQEAPQRVRYIGVVRSSKTGDGESRKIYLVREATKTMSTKGKGNIVCTSMVSQIGEELLQWRKRNSVLGVLRYAESSAVAWKRGDRLTNFLDFMFFEGVEREVERAAHEH